MKLDGTSSVVTGAASGLGLATTERLLAEGGAVVLVDLPSSDGAEVARRLGPRALFVPADVTDPRGVAEAVSLADSIAPLRALVHGAGIGGRIRIVDRDGQPGDLATFEKICRVNLVGSFNVLRLSAAAMSAHPAVDGSRGVCVLTSSIAGFEGQVGQPAYSSSKAAIGALALVSARDLASQGIRVCTIAPGLMDTPLLARLDDEVRAGLERGVPHPSRLGRAEEFAALAAAVIDNDYLNGRRSGPRRVAHAAALMPECANPVTHAHDPRQDG